MNALKKTNLIRLLATAALLLVVIPALAQEKADSVLTFRFLSGNDMFYSPGLNNGPELQRLFNTVDQYKEKILDHKIMLYVDGHSVSNSGKSKNLDIARKRSQRVKSEIITRKGLHEDCFITRNHASKGNYVTVRIVIPQEEITPAVDLSLSQAHQPADTIVEVEVEEIVAADTIAEYQPATAHQPEVVETPTTKTKSDSPFALKTNLLDYAILMPNLEVEWAFANRWSVALEDQCAWYAKNDPRKVYRIGTLISEFRYWVINHERWHGMYVGVFGGIGMYDLHRSATKRGHEGEGYMAGVSAGYMWPISKHLSLDAGFGVGYMHLRDKVYTPVAGHYLYQYTKSINYVGPLRLKLSLVWRIPM